MRISCPPQPPDHSVCSTLNPTRCDHAALRVVTRVVRPGKKVQIVEGMLLDGDVEVVRASALRLRTLDDELEPAWHAPDVAPLPPPGDAAQFPRMTSGQLGFWNAVEMSPVKGQLFVPGPASVWFRLRVQVIAGEDPSPLQRVAAVADGRKEN